MCQKYGKLGSNSHQLHWSHSTLYERGRTLSLTFLMGPRRSPPQLYKIAINMVVLCNHNVTQISCCECVDVAYLLDNRADFNFLLVNIVTNTLKQFITRELTTIFWFCRAKYRPFLQVIIAFYLIVSDSYSHSLAVSM